MPNENQVQVKQLYSFKPFGDQHRPRNHAQIFDTTFRSTMQSDSPFFRGDTKPFNVKHALVDPSHTFKHVPKKSFDFNTVCHKNGKDKTSATLQKERRNTQHFDGAHIIRLPDSRDRKMQRKSTEVSSPVDEFRQTVESNSKFFGRRNQQKIDLKKFTCENYLTAPRRSIGVPNHFSYFLTDEQTDNPDWLLESNSSKKDTSVRKMRSIDRYQLLKAGLKEEAKLKKQMTEDVK